MDTTSTAGTTSCCMVELKYSKLHPKLKNQLPRPNDFGDALQICPAKNKKQWTKRSLIFNFLGFLICCAQHRGSHQRVSQRTQDKAHEVIKSVVPHFDGGWSFLSTYNSL